MLFIRLEELKSLGLVFLQYLEDHPTRVIRYTPQIRILEKSTIGGSKASDFQCIVRAFHIASETVSERIFLLQDTV
jgi:hypothetical protein